MRDNADYRGEYLAGQARNFADWLVGKNFSRFYSESARSAGYEVLFSVGRVQTPTLGLVTARDREIEGFTSKPYFILSAVLVLANDRRLSGRWQPSEEAENTALDSDKRLTDPEFCAALREKLRGAAGKVSAVDRKTCKKAPPLPYSLAKLQMDAAKKYDITDTLKHLQKLYEGGYVTYPRSDCPYIPEGHFAEAPGILDAIAAACPSLGDVLKGVDTARKSPAWDTSKVTEHHAILPTAKIPLNNAFTDTERKIYELVCTRYVLQFLPDHEYEQTTVTFEAAGERFKAAGRNGIQLGWMGWEKDAEDVAENDEEKKTLPLVSVEETGMVEPNVEEKKTTPPKRFAYDTLIGAMNSIHLYVRDPEIRRQLRELDGIGTSATQENIVKLLFERGFIEKRGKQIFSTPLGRTLIDIVSSGKGAAMAKPDLTALWEQKMTRIEEGELSLEAFVSEVAAMIREVVKAPPSVPENLILPRREKCPAEGCGGYLNHITQTVSGPFFACPVCRKVYDDRDGKPVEKKPRTGECIEADCPLGCGGKARRFEGTYGPFWKCFCSPDKTFRDVEGKPVIKEDKPQARCPVKGCKGMAEQFTAKADGRRFWKCKTCRNFFDDSDGKPAVQAGREREKAPDKKAT